MVDNHTLVGNGAIHIDCHGIRINHHLPVTSPLVDYYTLVDVTSGEET